LFAERDIRMDYRVAKARIACRVDIRRKGGLSSSNPVGDCKVHCVADAQGRPLGFHLTGGEAADCKSYDVLIDLPEQVPGARLADKGYDSDVIRADLKARRIRVVIPPQTPLQAAQRHRASYRPFQDQPRKSATAPRRAVGRDIFMYSITLSPELDMPEILREYAETFGVQPGWLFLTGARDDVELLRRKLGFVDPDPVVDAEPAQHIGVVKFGIERLDRWAGCPALTTPEQIVRSILWMEAPTAKDETSRVPREAIEARLGDPRRSSPTCKGGWMKGGPLALFGAF
jgi:hypothetical protein